MSVTYGKPALPRALLNSEKLGSDLSRIFPYIKTDQVNRLVSLALGLSKQRHGAILVISDDAETEAERLAKQSTAIEPVLLTETLLSAVAAIDGAVMIRPDGLCFAIGVILDGMATPAGNPARGARFNSSVRYVGNRENCLVIIVSEDGTAEWIPDLMPQLSRKEIKAREDELSELLLQDVLNLDHSRRLLNWFSSHRFYLGEALCDSVNNLKKEYEDGCRRDGRLTIVEAPFVPCSEMNDRFFID